MVECGSKWADGRSTGQRDGALGQRLGLLGQRVGVLGQRGLKAKNPMTIIKISPKI